MTDTTTIQCKDSTKNDLEDLKQADGETFDSVLQRLIEGYSNPEGLDEATVRSIAQEQINDMVAYKALE